MTTLKPSTARLVCTRAVSLVTQAIASTDWTAPAMWEAARKAEAVSDRQFYRGPIKARTAPERDASLVLAMLEADQYTMGTLYGVREGFVKAVLIGHVHADKLRALAIDVAELRAAVEVLGDVRRA
jgi:hypothetical protein